MRQTRSRASDQVFEAINHQSDAAMRQETVEAGLHPLFSTGDPPDSKQRHTQRRQRGPVSHFLSQVPHPLHRGQIQRSKESEQRDIELHQGDTASPDGQK
jgi:hypothetical protein